MAFGFSPKHVQDVQLDNVTPGHFLVLSVEAARKLEWEVGYLSASGFIAYSPFSMSSGGEEIRVKIGETMAQIKSECTGNQMVDWGKNKENVNALLAEIAVLKDTITPEELELKRSALEAQFTSGDNEILKQPPTSAKEKITGFFALFKPVDGYFITPILVNLNILVFIVMIASGVHFLTPDGQDLLNWGANFRLLTMEGDWWRLLTACFIHIGILHLLLNMYALVYVGLLLEPYLGKAKFLSAYVISGIAASSTSICWHDLTISAGASGAIFGLYGLFLALLSTDLLDKSAKNALTSSIVAFVGYNLMNGFLPKSGIDNAAHIGGLISGLIIGYAFVPGLKKQGNKVLEYATIGGLALALLIGSVVAFHYVSNDIGKYEKKMREFVALEEKALEVYKMPEYSADEALLSALKEKGIYNWNESLKLLDSCNMLDLPLPIRTRNTQLRKYCELRIKTYELMCKAIEEQTNKYDAEINENNGHIEAIITSLVNKQ